MATRQPDEQSVTTDPIVVVGLAVQAGAVNDVLGFASVLFGRSVPQPDDQSPTIWIAGPGADDLDDASTLVADWAPLTVGQRLVRALISQAIENVSLGSYPIWGRWGSTEDDPDALAEMVAYQKANASTVNWSVNGAWNGFTGWGQALKQLKSEPRTTALVGASNVDGLLGDNDTPVGGVALVLQRESVARALGNEVLACVESTDDSFRPSDQGQLESTDSVRLCLLPTRADLAPRFGSSTNYTGLLYVLAGVLSVYHRLIPKESDRAAWPWLCHDSGRRAEIEFVETDNAESRQTVALWEVGRHYDVASPAYFLSEPTGMYLYAGDSADEVREKLEADEAERPSSQHWLNQPPADGPVRLALVAQDDDEWAQACKRALKWLKGDATKPQADLRKGVFGSAEPLGGKVALFCNSAATIYPGMGSEILTIFGDKLDEYKEGDPLPKAVCHWSRPSTPFQTPALIDMFAGGMYVSILHGKVSREIVGLHFDAVIGLSAGERSAPAAKGVAKFEHAVDSLQRTMDGELLTKHLGGQFTAVRKAWNLDPHEPVNWSVWRVLASVDVLREALEEFPRAHLAIIHANDDAMVAGDRDQCQQAFEKIPRATAFEIPFYELAYHVPEVKHAESAFRLTKRLVVQDDPQSTYYSSSRGEPFELDTESFLQVSFEQATELVDFPRVIERAYDDGVRVFVEHGARDHGVRWIKKILGDRPSAVIPLDRYNIDSLKQLLMAVAQLWTVGVNIDWDTLQGRLRAWRQTRDEYHQTYRQHRQRYQLEPFQPAPADSSPVASLG